MKLVYSFDQATKFFRSVVTLNDSDRDPMELDNWLIPGDCLITEPPTAPPGKVAKAINGEWKLVDEIKLPIQTERVQFVESSTKPVMFVPYNTPITNPLPADVGDKSRLTQLVQDHMDAVAVGYGYDSINSAVTYADEPAVPKFQAEGRAFRVWRSLVWATCYQLLDSHTNDAAIPSDKDIINLLPTLQVE